jgi:hypothetical protein
MTKKHSFELYMTVKEYDAVINAVISQLDNAVGYEKEFWNDIFKEVLGTKLMTMKGVKA